jgi:chromosome segregation ATPase
LKNKINNNVQVLAHLQEKYTFVNDECVGKKKDENGLNSVLKKRKEDLNSKKSNFENITIKKLQSKQKIDQINSSSLKKYYSKTNENIENLTQKINKIIVFFYFLFLV